MPKLSKKYLASITDFFPLWKFCSESHHPIDTCNVEAVEEVCKWSALGPFLHIVIMTKLVNSVNSCFISIVV